MEHVSLRPPVEKDAKETRCHRAGLYSSVAEHASRGAPVSAFQRPIQTVAMSSSTTVPTGKARESC